MKIKALLMLIALMAVLAGCDQGGVTSQGPRETLISKGFIDDNTWKVVCRGYPLEGLTGIQKSESSKRAALLGAYYFVQETFNETVSPDRDGKSEKFVMYGDHAELHYVIHKKGLKKMVKTGAQSVNK
jgi:hypothetical protein